MKLLCNCCACWRLGLRLKRQNPLLKRAVLDLVLIHTIAILTGDNVGQFAHSI